MSNPTSETLSALLGHLRDVVGAAHVLEGEGLEAYERDWRGRLRGRALAVVRPASTEQVAAVVRACSAAGAAIVPQGGNTGMVGGSVPDASGHQIVLQLGRMRAIRRLDALNLTVTVEAGCVLEVLQTEMRAAGLLFPLSLGAEGSCMIGGNLATNAGGTQVLRYGNARELCLGLEVVTPQGEVWNGLSGLRKDNTGYDLRDLFIGSEGTLGVITAATLKLFPLPAAVSTAWVVLGSIESALQLLGLARQRLGAQLTGFELMGRGGLDLVARHMPQLRIPLHEAGHAWAVLLECSDNRSEDHARQAFEDLLEEAALQGCIQDAAIAASDAQAAHFWSVREHITMAQAADGANVKHDISVPISCIAAFAAEAEAELGAAWPGARIVNFGHLGDGNLHFNVSAPAGSDALAFVNAHETAISDMVYRRVAKHGGSFSAEHGVGALKVDKLRDYKCGVGQKLMRLLKVSIDPQNIMNPGRVLEV